VDFWDQVDQVLRRFGQGGIGAPVLGFRRFPADIGSDQLGYDLYAGTRAKSDPNAAIEFERKFLELRLALLNLLTDPRNNLHVKEWQNGVRYVNGGSGREKPLRDCLPS
jgi:hypothetical protein